MNLTPTAIERSSRGERAYGIYSRLSEDRIIVLSDPIDDNVTSSVVAQSLFLDAQNSGKDIYLYINSPGGSVPVGLATFDTTNFAKAGAQMIILGMTASMGSFSLTAGQKGKRLILSNAEVMIHQPLGGAQGQATEVEIAVCHILDAHQRLNSILAERTGQPTEVIERGIDRGNCMTVEQAREYDLVDEVMENNSALN